MIKTYNEMMQYTSFEERYKYLRLYGFIGEDTFGFNRYINQSFYSSQDWKSVRSKVIIRDNGCDLGCSERPIYGPIQIHHITPVTLEQLENEDPLLFDLNNLVCTSIITHRAIHYGDEDSLIKDYVPRTPGDTKLW